MDGSPGRTMSNGDGGMRDAVRRGVFGLRRATRKHRLALSLVAVSIFIVFMPTFTTLRLLSPNDVYYHYDPWMSLSSVRAQNQLIHDPPLSYFTLVSLLHDFESFHWNRYIGGGIPGTGSVASAVLSPFVLIPALLLPLQWSYTGIVLLKLLVAFWFAYLWLREERMGKRGAAVGAIAIAVAGPVAVWWLWQATNATALYPALLFAVVRMARGKRNNLAAMVLLGVAFLLSGYPATTAFGLYFAVAYLAVSLVRFRALPRREIVKCVGAAAAAVAITAPLLDSYVGFLARTGYLDTRVDSSRAVFFPLSHLRSFLQPYWLGDPVARSWVGDPALGALNNFVESTVYLGVITIALAIVGLAHRRLRMRWLFALATTLILALMFSSPAGRLVAELPGLKYSPLIRLRVLLPIPVAYLASAGFALLDRRIRVGGGTLDRRWQARLAWMVAVAVAVDLSLFAAWFHPHITPEVAALPRSRTLEYLRAEPGPFRIAPTFLYLMPNSAQLARLEDVRAHWGAERAYRDLLKRIDPQSVDHATVITFNSLRMNLDDPVLGMLNARFLLEPPSIDILRYLIEDRTEWVERAVAPIALRAGGHFEREFTITREGVWAIAIPLSHVGSESAESHLAVTLSSVETGNTVFEATYDAEELAGMPALHLPILPTATAFRSFLVDIRSSGAAVNLYTAAEGAGASRLAWGMIERPLILERAFRDGRIYRNLAVLPRFWPVWEVETIERKELLTDAAVDFSKRAYFAGPMPLDVRHVEGVEPSGRRVVLDVSERGDGGYEIVAKSGVPFLLSSSEKLTPELRVRIDGTEARALTINAIFAGVVVPAGEHRIVFERRIGRGWWGFPVCALGVVAVCARLERRRPVSPPAR